MGSRPRYMTEYIEKFMSDLYDNFCVYHLEKFNEPSPFTYTEFTNSLFFRHMSVLRDLSLDLYEKYPLIKKAFDDRLTKVIFSSMPPSPYTFILNGDIDNYTDLFITEERQIKLNKLNNKL